jgi:hypothetical protein
VLIVSATEDSHEQIEELLGLLRKRWGTLRTVTVHAYWLWLAGAELESLLAAEEDEGARPFRGTVNRKAWQKVLQHVEKDDERPIGYRAIVTCYNGQTVHVASNDHSLAVTRVEPVVSQGVAAYHPKVSVVLEGAALQVTPTASASGKYAVLDLHSRVTRLRDRGLAHGAVGAVAVVASARNEAAERRAQDTSGSDGKRTAEEPAKVPAASGPQLVALPPVAIDRPQLAEHRLATTLRIPVDQPTLVGGMTHSLVAGPDRRQLYLFVQTSVQELKDEPRAAEPADLSGEQISKEPDR